MVVSSICVCLGQLFWKLSSTNGCFALIIGFALYAVGALLMIIAYKYGKLSVIQPILSLNYVLSTILAVTVLNEEITLLKCTGILVIIVGVICIAGGDD